MTGNSQQLAFNRGVTFSGASRFAQTLAALKTDEAEGAFELQLPARRELQLRLARVLFTNEPLPDVVRSRYTLRSEPADALRFAGCSAEQRELPVIR